MIFFVSSPISLALDFSKRVLQAEYPLVVVDGGTADGRFVKELTEIGAHVYGYNDDSLGICLIGNFDIEFPNRLQLNSLSNLIKDLKSKFDIKEIKTHRDFPNVTKTCPGKNFNISMLEA